MEPRVYFLFLLAESIIKKEHTMVIDIILFLLHKYVARLDVLRTKYPKYKRMRIISYTLAMYMDSLVQFKRCIQCYTLYERLKYDLAYTKVLFRVIWTIFLYKLEFRSYEIECANYKLVHSREILENLRLAA